MDYARVHMLPNRPYSSFSDSYGSPIFELIVCVIALFHRAGSCQIACILSPDSRYFFGYAGGSEKKVNPAYNTMLKLPAELLASCEEMQLSIDNMSSLRWL